MKKRFISESILRKEINCMIKCFTEELFKIFSKKDIIGIYLLGSTNKVWDSDIDYIPKFSDVDINIYVKDPEKFKKYFSDIKTALDFSKKYEKKYLKKMPHANHIPKLQAQLHNSFLSDLNHLAPADSVKTLYGVDYKTTIPVANKEKYDALSPILEHEGFTKGMPIRIMSSDAEKIHKYAHEFYWRVCSAVSAVLCANGKNKDEIMCMNKTNVIKQLKSNGFTIISKNYELMLKNALKYSLSSDIDDARNMLLYGYKTLQLCVAQAKSNKFSS